MPPQDLEALVRWAYDWFNREREPPPMWLPDDRRAAMDPELANVLTLDEKGRTRRLQEFFDRGEALQAAGLEA
jgi:hypothetical protein